MKHLPRNIRYTLFVVSCIILILTVVKMLSFVLLILQFNNLWNLL